MPDRMPRRLTTLLLALLMAIPLSGTAGVAAAAPTTAELDSAEAQLERLINQRRARKGKRPFRVDARVASLARDKSQDMIDRDYFSHRDRQGHYVEWHLKRAGVHFSRAGEIIAWGRGGDDLADSASEAMDLWMGSSIHRRQIMASNNYFGAGVATNGRTWKWTVIFVTAGDHTRPTARITSLSAEGTDIRVTWTGHDPVLVVNTAGLRGFDVQRRVPGGAWVVVRRLTRSTAYGVSAPAGTSYEFRVRARDRAGNVGAWSAPSAITT